MPVKKGDFVLVDYVTTIKETGDIFDATKEEDAKKGGISKENAIYEPMLIVVGEGWVLKKLDDSLIGIDVEKRTVIEVSPEEGFGLRDPAKIKVIPIDRFKKQNIKPYPGAQIEINGKMAAVRSVGAGRVQVDFNPPLAGKTLIYDLVVNKIIDERLEKIKALIHRRIPSMKIEKIKLDVTEKEATIDLPEDVYYIDGIQITKRGIASDLQHFFLMEKIIFIETFKPVQTQVEGPQKPSDDSKDTLHVP